MDPNPTPLATADHALNVLFVGGFDSTNYAYVELVHELARRGHRSTVVVEDERDSVNNKMFASAGIPVLRLSRFPLSELAGVDIVVSGPFVRERTRALFGAIHDSGKYLISLANLFSSVTMWTAPDLVITASESKFAEFARSGLAYNMVAVGNPQYDPLTRTRATRPSIGLDQIRDVLVVDQGAYPLGAVGKRQLAETLTAIAVNNPRLTLHVKPRYVPGEGGEHLHSVSDHLYNFLRDTPDNLVLMREPSILEEILPSCDAMITTWSTAHLDAVALGMPLLLIGGLDSVDVFDVRRQRVAAAYAHLETTGCVVDRRDLLTGACPFGRVSAQYADEEFYDVTSVSAPRIVAIMEAIDTAVLRRGLALAGRFQLPCAEFMEQVGSLETREAGTVADRLDRRYFRAYNTVAQTLAFDDRTLGFALDLSGMLALWDRTFGSDASTAAVDGAVREARASALRLKADYFAAHPDLVACDMFVQDAYFDWLLATGRRSELASYSGAVVAPQSLAFDRGVAALRSGRLIRAARLLTDSFDVSLREPVPVLKKDKNIRTLLSRADHSPAALAALTLLGRGQRWEALTSLDVPSRPGHEALVYHRMRALVALGRSADASATATEYAASIRDQAPQPPARGPKDLLMRCATALYRGRVRRLAKKTG
jgi:hypothetical protein